MKIKLGKLRQLIREELSKDSQKLDVEKMKKELIDSLGVEKVLDQVVGAMKKEELEQVLQALLRINNLDSSLKESEIEKTKGGDKKMAKSNKELMKLLSGISQVMANSYDGSYGEEKEKTPLKREKGDPILDTRIIDGFGISLSGDRMIVKYQSEVVAEDTKDPKFETNIAQMLADIISYVKKEYKRITGDALSVKEDTKPIIQVEHISMVRTQVLASQVFKINGLEVKSVFDKHEKKIDDKVRKFLDLAKSAKDPDNLEISRQKQKGELK